jgi:hypothetical protein
MRQREKKSARFAHQEAIEYRCMHLNDIADAHFSFPVGGIEFVLLCRNCYLLMLGALSEFGTRRDDDPCYR